MKNRIIIVVLLLFHLLFLTGCQGSETGGRPQEPIQQLTMEECENYNYSSFHMGALWQTPTGVYIMAEGNNGNYVYYGDKENLDWIPLCARPDCRHSDNNCNAYVEDSASIGMFQEHLYYVKRSFENGVFMELWRMELDGGNHEKVKEIPLYENMTNCAMEYFFHKGYLVYYVETGQESAAKYKICILPLKQEEDCVEVVSETGRAGTITIFPENEILYLVHSHGEEENLWEWDLNKMTGKIVVDSLPIPFMAVSVGETSFTNVVDCREMVSYDRETWEEEKMFSLNLGDRDSVYTDGTYYLCGEMNEFTAVGKEPGGELLILDKKGKKVQGIEFPEEVPVYYYGITEEHIFFYDGQYGFAGLPYWYLEKAKIGTDELEWKYVGE